MEKCHEDSMTLDHDNRGYMALHELQRGGASPSYE